MKSVYVVTLIALMSLLGHAQTRSDAYATYALKGPVQTLRIETATFVPKDGDYVEGVRTLQMEASFNEDGNRTDLHMYDDKGALIRRIATRFEGQRMLEAANYDGAGRMWLRIENIYDDKGRMKEETTYNGDGSVRTKKGFKRNEQGQLIEVTAYNPAGVLLEQIKYRYQGDNRIGYERKLFRPNGSLQSLAIYEAEKNHSETITYKPDGSVENKLVRNNQQVTQYGPDGSLVKTTILSENRPLDAVTVNGDGSSSREADLGDQLDSHGNWTRQTKWFTDSKGTKPLTVTYRTISYYNRDQ